MAWPFAVPAVGPTSFRGPGAAVPLAATEIAGGAQIWLLGIHLLNVSAGDRTVTVTNSADVVVWKGTLPPGGSPPVPYSPTFQPSLGLKWFVDVGNGADVLGHVWGY